MRFTSEGFLEFTYNMQRDARITFHETIIFLTTKFEKNRRINSFHGRFGQFNANITRIFIPGNGRDEMRFFQFRYLQILLYGGQNTDHDVDGSNDHGRIRLIIPRNTGRSKGCGTTDGGKGNGGYGKPCMQRIIVMMTVIIQPFITLCNVTPFGHDFFVIIRPFDFGFNDEVWI